MNNSASINLQEQLCLSDSLLKVIIEFAIDSDIFGCLDWEDNPQDKELWDILDNYYKQHRKITE